MRSLVAAAALLLAGMSAATSLHAEDRVMEVTRYSHIVRFEPGPRDPRPAGWVLAPGPSAAHAEWFGGDYVVYDEDSLRMHPLAELASFEGRFCELRGRLEVGGIDGTYDVFHATYVSVPAEAVLVQPLLDDLAARGVDFMRDGTPVPRGDLTAAGVCADGAVAVALPLSVPIGSDMFADVAFICRDSGLYWARRSGGIAGWTFWVGPFPTPGAEEPGPDAPDTEFVPARVSPRRVRVRARARTRTLVIRSARDGARMSGEEPLPADDIDLGPGITVREVLRHRGRRIRVRAEIAPDAALGMRDVRVRDRTASGIFEVRPRRRR